MTENIYLHSETSKTTVRDKNYKPKRIIRTGEDMIGDKNYHKLFEDEEIIDKWQVIEAQRGKL